MQSCSVRWVGIEEEEEINWTSWGRETRNGDEGEVVSQERQGSGHFLLMGLGSFFSGPIVRLM